MRRGRDLDDDLVDGRLVFRPFSESVFLEDLRTALAAVRELARIVELQAKLAGDLIDAPTVNVTLGADWTDMRAAILSALDLYPEARVAVARPTSRRAPRAEGPRRA